MSLGMPTSALYGEIVVTPRHEQKGDGVAARKGSVVSWVAALLALTYLAPRWAQSWESFIVAEADHDLVERGLGPAMATFLRRYPQTMATIARPQVLDVVPVVPGTRLRLVHG